MSCTPAEQIILEASQILGSAQRDGYVKCDRVIRLALEMGGLWTDATNEAVCLTGYEDPTVALTYDAIRSLTRRGLLEGKGDLVMPAGPRYTECCISQTGLLSLRTKL
jgi:hypothetical protein